MVDLLGSNLIMPYFWIHFSMDSITLCISLKEYSRSSEGLSLHSNTKPSCGLEFIKKPEEITLYELCTEDFFLNPCFVQQQGLMLIKFLLKLLGSKMLML